MKLGEKDGKKILACTCGFIKDADITSSEKISIKEVGRGIADGKRKAYNFPHTCPKCNHEGCEAVNLGSSQSDEADILLFICDECGYVDRQADGCSNG